MQHAIQGEITNLKLDLEELQTLLLDSSRPNVQAFLNTKIAELR